MEQFIGDLHKQANDVAREFLALDALARELKIEVTEDDINAEFEKAGATTSRLPRPSLSPMAVCLPSASPSVAPRPSTTWSRTPR